jgi:hypothetical protein
MAGSADRLQYFARERAEQEARRVHWQRLFEARNQYIDWQEFSLWVRSIVEVEDWIPDWLAKILADRVLGFLENEKTIAPGAAAGRSFPLRLEDWIDNHIFSLPKQEGWFNAVMFFAVREPRYQKAEVCWLECVEKWKKTKPDQYPSFDEWKAMAAYCDESAHLLSDVRKARASAKVVAPDRLVGGVSRWIDWEALAYWARPALEAGSELPAQVASELGRCCPGFLAAGSGARAQGSVNVGQDWLSLMCWIGDQYFHDAKAEGWFDAILAEARSHPRAIRTMEYADRCDEVWSQQMPEPYPSFEDWRRDADAYVDLDD